LRRKAIMRAPSGLCIPAMALVVSSVFVLLAGSAPYPQAVSAADDLQVVLQQATSALPQPSSLPGLARWTISRNDDVSQYANGFTIRRYFTGVRQIKCGSSNFNDTFAAYCGVNYQTGAGFGNARQWQSQLLNTYASSSGQLKYSAYSGPPTGVLAEGQLLTGAGMVGQKMGKGAKLAFWKSPNCVADVSMNIVDFCSADPSTPPAAVREKEALEMCRTGCIQMAGSVYNGLPSTATSGGGPIPDSILPWIAIGPLLVITFLTLLNNLIQGIPVRESFSDLIDFLRGSPGKPPAQPVQTTVQPTPETNINIGLGHEQDGKVWCLPPWEQGGPVWLDKAEYEAWQDKERQGLVWSDSYGWTAPETAGEYDTTRLRRWQYDTTHRLTGDLNELQSEYDNIAIWLKDRQWKEAYWNEQLKPHWEELQKLNDQMIYDNAEVDRYTFSGSARELFTCRDAHGNLSLEALGTQVAVMTVTGGLGGIPLRLGGWAALEIPYSAAVFAFGSGTYNSYDRWMAGEPLPQAVIKGYGTAAGVEIISAGLGKGLSKIIGTGVSEALEETAKSAAGRGTGGAVAEAAGKAGTAGRAALSPELELVRKGVEEAAGADKLVRSANGIKKTYGPALKGANDVEKRIVQTAERVEKENHEKMLDLLKQRDKLTELQKRGAVSQEQINRVAGAASKEVDDILDKTVPQTMKEFEEKTGVKVLKNFTGNQGSSARPGGSGRFIATTDEDRSLAQLFEDKQLQAYADKFHSGNHQSAYDDLNKQFTDLLNTNVGHEAANRKLSSEMLGYTGYAGSGTKAGPGSYASGFVDVSQQAKGSTIIHYVDEAGTVRSYKTSGQAWTDAHQMARTPAGDVIKGVAPRPAGSGVINGEAALSMAKNAKKIADKEAVESVEMAKGIVRFDKALTILEGPRLNRAVYETARWLREKPSEAMQALGPEKLAEFTSTARKVIQDAYRMLSGHGE
jgi:hypothetical protein